MQGLRQFITRHTLWVGLLAVLVPLTALLGLQYSWLVKLEKTSAIAHTAHLNNYLQAVATKVRYFYASNAERALNLPASMFVEGCPTMAARHFGSKKIEGAKELFVISFVELEPQFLFYDADRDEMVARSWSPEVRAAYIASAPLRVISSKRTGLDSVALSVDERDPQNRMILNPIVDDTSYVVAIAGMIVDEQYFENELLPAVISKSLPFFFAEGSKTDLIVTVRDQEGRTAHASQGAERVESDIEISFPFIFTDWKIGLQSRSLTPEAWAKTNFAFNVGLSAMIAVVLLAGIILALHTASRALKLSTMKSDFVSNVSHELRTPIASIRVFGEFLRWGRADTPDKSREYGEYIEAESRRLTQLVDNILDFAKIESGRKTYQLEEIRIEQIVEDVLHTFEVRLKHDGFELDFKRPAKPLPPINADPQAIAQAVHNLLDNAVKYSGDARAVCVELGQEDGFVTLSVSDRGIGIARDEQRRIFERFHRVSTGLVHDVKGSGLGLAIVEHVVKAHGGKIMLRSEPGEGSTFTLQLPISPDVSPASEPSATPEAARP
ncbi:MAG: HAMP domain-containing histidine kinase [Acidobacteriota bacterium]|nr:MAG: HAMP domain-containing histidine kinase [Acidobacteriota bacterium]